MRKKYSFHEDFSGGGMVRVGLGSRWECFRACDIDLKKCQSYRENFGSEHLYEGDIGKVDVSAAKPAQLAWASFPCQDTSLAGGYTGLAGKRSGTFWKWWRIVEGMKKAGKPYDVLCIENVRGLLTSNGGADFLAICKALAGAGYVFGAAVIDTAHFLPHSRERLFIVGVRSRRRLVKIFKSTPSDLWHPQSMRDVHEKLPSKIKKYWAWFTPPKPRSKRPTLSSIIESEGAEVAWHSVEETRRLVSMMSTENKRKLNEQKRKNRNIIGMLYKRIRNGNQQAEIRFDGVAGCLRTARGGSSRQTVIVVRGANVRSRLLSAREAASLMGLPRSYKLPKKYNDAYNLCGDGVAVPVVRFLAKTVFMPVLKAIEASEIRST